MGKRNGVNIVLTAQMKDDYQKVIKKDKGGKILKKSVKVWKDRGILRKWQTYGSKHYHRVKSLKRMLLKTTGKYLAVCEKSICC